MKKLLCLLMTFLMVWTLFGCDTAENKAQSAFEKTMDAFKSGDETKIDIYYSLDKLTSYLEKQEGVLLADAVLSTLAKMDYKIKSTEKVSDNAVKINMELTTVDFSLIIDDYIKRITAMVNSAEYQKNIQQINEEEYKKLMADEMISAIQNCGDKRATKEASVTMIKIGSKWEVSGNDEEFLGVLFENLSTAVEMLV